MHLNGKAIAAVQTQVKSATAGEGGATEVKLAGTPAANFEAKRLLDDLATAAESSSISELIDNSRPAPDTLCSICFGDIEPSDRYLMEPCLHAYHKVCSKEGAMLACVSQGVQQVWDHPCTQATRCV